ncbi:hypothetical protein [Succinimonas sp.]|uniref:hypothetical protein n=1 Tax=Succinimonas sp. TaxID=1936151 RepID=UPI00386FDBB5
MNSAQKSACHKIIHSAAAAAAAGNLVPVPGTGFAVDMGVMVAMVMSLARVFKLDSRAGAAESKKRAKKMKKVKDSIQKQLPENWKKHVAKESAKIISKKIAREIAMTALKKQIAAQPIRYITKETAKSVPILGTILSSAISAGLIEDAGWRVAADFDRSS